MTASEWNERFPVGTAVDWIMDNGEVVAATTDGPARQTRGGLHVIPLDCSQYGVLLTSLRVAAPDVGKGT